MLDMINSFDYGILLAIEQTRNAFFDAFFKVYTSLGNAGISCIVLSVLLLLISKTRKIGASCSVSLVYHLLICNITLKPLIARPRPFDFFEHFSADSLLISAPLDYSFPSGHTAACFAFSTAVFMYNRKWGIVSFVLSAIMGYSRLYLSVHYPTDVLGGIVVGIVCGVLAVKTTNSLYSHFSKKSL